MSRSVGSSQTDMDFNELLKQQIDKKRSCNAQARIKSNGGAERACDTGVKKPVQSVESACDTGVKKPGQNVESIGNEEAPPSSMLEIPTAVLDSRIAEFNVLCKGLSKSEKVAKLAWLIHDKARSEKYRDWLAIEAPLYANPPSKAIDVQHVGSSSTLLRAQLRVWIKDTVRKLEVAATLEDTIIEQTKRDLVPLLYKLRANTLDPDIATSLATVVYHIQHAQYRHANESYYQLSVGNVAWPIGVRDVGIHARSNEHRLANQPTANIMRSDSTRRWITAIKRLLSFVESGHHH